MKCKHHDLEFELEDEWLIEADMVSYSPTEASYKPDLQKTKGEEILLIPINEIAPLIERAKCKGIFCDNENDTAKERVVRILKWFKEHKAIEPISVAELGETEKFKYKVLAGSHRFHCSIAVGFTKMPAILGFDINA